MGRTEEVGRGEGTPVPTGAPRAAPFSWSPSMPARVTAGAADPSVGGTATTVPGAAGYKYVVGPLAGSPGVAAAARVWSRGERKPSWRARPWDYFWVALAAADVRLRHSVSHAVDAPGLLNPSQPVTQVCGCFWKASNVSRPL